MLNVFTNLSHAGTLERVDLTARFTYGPNVTAQNIVSLTMPPVPNATTPMYEQNIVHPIFAMNLPEGRLHESLVRMFSKTIPDMDDMTLLEIVGRSQIGRLRTAPSIEELDKVPSYPLQELLKTRGAENMLDELLERYARYSGVSGYQPKILVRDNDSLNDTHLKSSLNRVTAHGTTHIVKFFEAEKFPALASNEYLCLRAAKAAGLPVPNFYLSDDAQCLVIERFDLKPDGTYLAVEDCCALAGYYSSQKKYDGSYENVAKSLAAVIAPAHIFEDMNVFFRSLVLSIIVRNGDAHLKNFSVVYNDSSDVRLSPVYDIVSTVPYFRNDVPALEFNNNKRWPDYKALIQFAVNLCKLSPTAAKNAIAQVSSAVAKTRDEVPALRDTSSDKPAFMALSNMLAAWEKGLSQMGA